MHYYFRLLKKIFNKPLESWLFLLISCLKILLHAKIHLSSKTRHNISPFSIQLRGIHITFYSYASLLYLFEEIFIDEVYRFNTSSPSPWIVDCGSNIGLSVLYFKKLYPQSRITAFEPDRVSFALLKKNIEDNNLADVAIHNLALGSNREERKFFLNAEPGSMNNSLIKTDKSADVDNVNTALLSEYINSRVDFVKIDTEGAEGEIIRDICESGKIDLVQQLFFEYHLHCPLSYADIDKLLVGKGMKRIANEGTETDKLNRYSRNV